MRPNRSCPQPGVWPSRVPRAGESTVTAWTTPPPHVVRPVLTRAELEAEMHRVRRLQERGPEAMRARYSARLDVLLDEWRVAAG